MKQSKVIAVIPARSGSKGIPHKNIVDLAGKPLIAYTIEAALKSKTLNRVVVSTDDAKIAKVAELFGAEVPFLRPESLAKDNTPTLPVIQHAVEYVEKQESHNLVAAVILQPTSPLRSEKYIDQSVNLLLSSDSDSVVTVREVHDHPYWSWKAEKDLLTPFIKKGMNVNKRQDLPKVYALNGAVYAVKRDVIVKENLIFGSRTRMVVMPKEESIDIDEPFDLFMAQMVLENWKKWEAAKERT
jgi:CMP-N,N'-diacetyllegionaminic acid synthase